MENITSRDPVWRENGAQFVTSVSKLLERLLDYRSVIQVKVAFYENFFKLFYTVK